MEVTLINIEMPFANIPTCKYKLNIKNLQRIFKQKHIFIYNVNTESNIIILVLDHQ